jgi:hypothetical protein
MALFGLFRSRHYNQQILRRNVATNLITGESHGPDE